ncbi:MAG: AAC(3) family N-acetyltransferase [Desulfovibrionaceae bacterium]
MKAYSLEAFDAALDAVGIVPGDAVMVHAALFPLGRLTGVAFDAIAATLAERLMHRLGPDGTVVVPIYNYDNIDFFKHYTLRQMGPLAEYVAALPQARRTWHTIFSLAAVGRLAQGMAACDALSAYAVDGPFEYLLAQGAKVLLLGTGVSAASVLHVAEERVAVPYRYWVEFPGERPAPGGGMEPVPYRMFVRDLDRYPSLRLDLVADWLREDGALRSVPLGGGKVTACSFAAYVDAVTVRLRERPGALVSAD